MKIVGIDPGNTGGMAVCENGEVIGVVPMPSHKITPVKKTYTVVDFSLVAKFLIANKPDKVYIELVGARPGQGGVSMFNFGYSTGGLHGICAALGIPVKTVRPQEWKRLIFGTSKGSGDKQDAIDFCETNCPNISLLPTKRSRTPSDGIADAICISIYGMRDSIIDINKNNDGEK